MNPGNNYHKTLEAISLKNNSIIRDKNLWRIRKSFPEDIKIL